MHAKDSNKKPIEGRDQRVSFSTSRADAALGEVHDPQCSIAIHRTRSRQSSFSMASCKSGRSGRRYSNSSDIENFRSLRQSGAVSLKSGQMAPLSLNWNVGETSSVVGDDVCLPSENRDRKEVNLDMLDQYLQDNSSICSSTNEHDRPFCEDANQCCHGKTDRDGLESACESAAPLKFTKEGNIHVATVSDSDETTDGTETNRYTFFATNMDSTIGAESLSSLVAENDSFSSLFNEQNGVWWLDCFNPTDRELKVLSRAFGIHPLTAEDIRAEESREKFELFKHYYFIVFNTFGTSEDHPTYLLPTTFYIIVYDDGILTFHFSPLDHCYHVRERMKKLKGYIDISPDWICYALIDAITDSFVPVLEGVEDQVALIESAVFTKRNTSGGMGSVLSRLGKTRDIVMRVLRLIAGKADVIHSFGKRVQEQWAMMPGKTTDTTDISLFLGDIEDHLVSMHHTLSAQEKILSRCHMNYMGILQLEFVNSNNRMTLILSKVTILGTILIPLNLVTGLWGMNVKVPGEQDPIWFWGIVGVMVVAAVVLFVGTNHYIKKLTSDSTALEGDY